jgi:DNA-binding NarL/FixJ family response regulator
LSDAGSPGRGRRVAIVDDHDAVRRSTARLLENAGYSVVLQAGTIGEALELLPTVPLDVVLIDLTLPDGDGAEAIGRVRAAASGAHVIAMSGDDPSTASARVLRAGGDGYVDKVSRGFVTTFTDALDRASPAPG